jgi:hypothetical protein
MNEKSKGLKVKITLLHFNLQQKTYTYNCRTLLNKPKKIKTNMKYILSVKLLSGSKYSTPIANKEALFEKLKELINNLKNDQEISVIIDK